MIDGTIEWEEKTLDVLKGADFKKMFFAAAQIIDREKEQVNALNVFPVPDGDTGTNMALTLAAALRELDKVDSVSVSKVCAAVARGSLMGARGNSGVILSQYFRGFSEGLSNVTEATGEDLARALTMASETTYRAVLKPVEGTMLTVGKAAAKAANDAAKHRKGAEIVLEAAIEGARNALDNTMNMLPVLKQAGVVDAGGKGLLLILESALAGLRNHDLVVSEETKTPVTDVIQPFEEGITLIDGVLVNKYCTEFIIQGKDLDVGYIRDHLEPHGESMLVVGDGDVVKVHIHTDHPGLVLEFCAEQGDLTEIKIDNMKLQNQQYTQNKSMEAEKESVRKPIGIVAVSPGKELSEIMMSLGVDEIVHGGQTMNPSTEELVKAVENVNADAVIILPNNKNIIFSAQQVREFVTKELGVLATRTVPQGIASLISFNPEASLEANLAEMEQAMRLVKTGEVTYAVRASKAGELNIEEQDIIGLVEGKISCVGQCIADVTIQLVEHMVSEDSSVISIYYGQDQDPEEAEALRDALEEKYPDCEVEVYKGGQPLYYYILSVE